MEIFTDALLDYLLVVLSIVIAAVGIFLLANWKKLGAWIQTQKAKGQQELLWNVAQEAYIRAEGFIGENGQAKMQIALEYGLKKLNQFYRVNVSAEELQAKIQEAWVKLEKIPKGK